MDAGLVLQEAAVASAVAGSVLYVLLTRFPAATRRLRIAVAMRLVGSRIEPLVRLGRSLAPAPRAGTGCGGCGGCE